MSNPFEALDISDDEDEQQFIGTKGEQKPRKSKPVFYIQLTKREDNSRRQPQKSQ